MVPIQSRCQKKYCENDAYVQVALNVIVQAKLFVICLQSIFFA